MPLQGIRANWHCVKALNADIQIGSLLCIVDGHLEATYHFIRTKASYAAINIEYCPFSSYESFRPQPSIDSRSTSY